MPQMSLRDTTVYVGGLAGIIVEVNDGNLTYTEARPLKYITAGNDITDVVEDDEKPVDLKLDFAWKRATATTVELLERIKGAVGLTSSDTEGPCRPYAVNIVVKYRSNCAEPAVYRQILFKDFRYASLDYDLKGGKISVSGACNVLKIDSPTIITT